MRDRNPGNCDVCIVGGGPAGLAAAIALRDKNYCVTVIDCATPPIDKACGEGLMPDSIVVLNRLGIGVPAAAGFSLEGVRFADTCGSVYAKFPNGNGLGIRRKILHQLLLGRAQAVGVSFIWDAKNVRLRQGGVSVNGHPLKATFIVGADGQNSFVRRQARLDRAITERKRFGFRRHYRVQPWSSYMELHWGHRCQLYITPIAQDQICVALISDDSKLRLDEALPKFPEVWSRLDGAEVLSADMGALSVSRKLRRIHTGNLALVGDASGSVDAVTGEGMCLSFKQAIALANAIASGSLEQYERQHRALGRRARAMGALLMGIEKHGKLRRRILAALACRPEIFSSLLAIHVGESSFLDLIPHHVVSFGAAFLAPERG